MKQSFFPNQFMYSSVVFFRLYFALIFREQKLHQGSRRRVGRGGRKSRSVSLHNLARKAREKPLDKCHLDGWLWK